MTGCIDCVWAVAVLDKDGNQIAYRCTQPKCENGEYYEEEQEEEQCSFF